MHPIITSYEVELLTQERLRGAAEARRGRAGGPGRSSTRRALDLWRGRSRQPAPEAGVRTVDPRAGARPAAAAPSACATTGRC